MTKWYGLGSDGQAYYLGEHEGCHYGAGAFFVSVLLKHHRVVWDIVRIMPQGELERIVQSVLQALDAKVLVEVSGGVADITAPDYIPVELMKKYNLTKGDSNVE